MDAQKIGEFIKEQRKLKCLTQKELADKINCTDRRFRDGKQGEVYLRFRFFFRFRKLLT